MTPANPGASQVKRFWSEAAAGPKSRAGFPILLDGRGAKTPEGAKLAVPTEALARLIAEEWAAQGEELSFASMPLTRIAFTAIDRTPRHREAVVEEIVNYAGTDLVCYFAEGPEALVEREVAHWAPVLDWAQSNLGLRLERTSGIVHRPQPPETLERVRALALELDDFRLTGLAAASALLGSAVLAFALERGELDAETAFELSRLDEAFQNELWGEDPEAACRTAGLKAEASALGRWFIALG